jgi:NAD(P)-dependent dehydrogenase (short-subunit alcohol dehydrogenase family)
MSPARQSQAELPLAGKLAFVTGGGRGLGAAICTALAGAGAHVAVADLDRASAERVAGSLEEHGGRGFAVRIDVGDADGAPRALLDAAERHGGLHALINNAGIDYTLPVDELSIAQWDAVLRTNLRGPFLLARAASTLMKSQGNGHIVNVASTAATRAWPNASAYHASKWGLLGLSRALHAELRPFGIKVTAVIAGGMQTPFLLDRFPDIDRATLQDPANVALTVRHVLLQPEGTVIPEVMVLPMGETSWP